MPAICLDKDEQCRMDLDIYIFCNECEFWTNFGVLILMFLKISVNAFYHDEHYCVS